MLSTGQQAADFLKIFHPILKASGLNTTIACCDGGGWEESRKQLSGLQGAGAEDTLEIASGHGYFSPPRTAFNTTKRVCASHIFSRFQNLRTYPKFYLHNHKSEHT
jgi:hypothetical protein